MSNQRPNSVVEFKNTGKTLKPTIFFDENQVCSACKYKEIKDNQIDWKTVRACCNKFDWHMIDEKTLQNNSVLQLKQYPREESNENPEEL